MPTSIGERIKNKAFRKIGTTITPLTGFNLVEQPQESILTELSNQATKVFIQEFYLKGYFPFDTVCVPGDYIRTDYDGEIYQIMNLNNEPFKNQVVQKHATLYKSNNTVRVQYQTKVLNPQTYNEEIVWVDRHNIDIPCSITDTRFGAEISDYNNIGELVLDNAVVYFSRNFLVKELDRLVFSSGKTMKVDVVSQWNYGYSYEVEISEDNR